jgi:hypothetical protein
MFLVMIKKKEKKNCGNIVRKKNGQFFFLNKNANFGCSVGNWRSAATAVSSVPTHVCAYLGHEHFTFFSTLCLADNKFLERRQKNPRNCDV